MANEDLLRECYFETVEEALNAGHDDAQAHNEGVTAAAMMLASMGGGDEAAARATVEGLGFTVAEVKAA